MKNYILLIILSFVPLFVFPQTHRSTDSKKLNEALKAYFFIKGQELSLEYLEKNEPSDQNLKKVTYNALLLKLLSVSLMDVNLEIIQEDGLKKTKLRTLKSIRIALFSNPFF